MKLVIPSGIGDSSWLVSKLINVPEWSELEFEITDGWPYRTGDFFKLLGKETKYVPISYEDILVFEKMHPYTLWKDVSGNGFGRFFIQPNTYLERMKLEDYLPDLKTDYHYKLSLPKITRKWYYSRLRSASWVGISAASYRGANAWKTWGTGEWIKLIKMILRRGYNIALLGGSWDDLTKQLLYNLRVEDRILNLIGETTFGEVCSVQKMLKFYIGFCSGLGIVRTVLGLPTIMLWPEHMQFLRTSWADPEDIKNYKYIASGYLSPKEVFSTFKFQEKFYG